MRKNTMQEVIKGFQDQVQENYEILNNLEKHLDSLKVKLRSYLSNEQKDKLDSLGFFDFSRSIEVKLLNSFRPFIRKKIVEIVQFEMEIWNINEMMDIDSNMFYNCL